MEELENDIEDKVAHIVEIEAQLEKEIRLKDGVAEKLVQSD